nr:hypothetical protein [Lentilactobacillus buchneri]
MEMQFNKTRDRHMIMTWLQGALENHHFDFTATITWMIKHGNDYRYEYQRQAFQRLTIDQRKVVKKWDSCIQAEKAGFNCHHIGQCANHRVGRRTHKGFCWKWVSDTGGNRRVRR